jgi:hypothetical protein
MSDPPPWEISSPPYEKREDYFVTNASQNSFFSVCADAKIIPSFSLSMTEG